MVGDEFIWNFVRDFAVLLVEFDIFFVNDFGSIVDGVVVFIMDVTLLLVFGVRGVEGLRVFVLFWCGVNIFFRLRLRDGCEKRVCEL